MTILPQTNIEKILTSLIQEEVTIRNLISPLNTSFTINNYTDLLTSVSDHLYHKIREELVNIIETIDEKFRELPDRSQRYYVKDIRPRTLVTPIGVITFNRTIYQSKVNKSTYVHVDEKLELPKYDRYDPCVKAMIVETYTKLNSIIKVGELIGDRIYNPFSLKTEREHYRIFRQTVFNIITKAGQLIFEPPPASSQVDSLIIMADEKFIALQNSHKKKEMIKAVTIFKSRKLVNQRINLLNKYVVLATGPFFWEKVHHLLDARYDKSTTSNWIKSGLTELKTSNTTTTFSLDKFHFQQAINQITIHSEIKLKLIECIEGQDKNNFNKLSKLILENKDLHLKQAASNIKYILKNWEPLQNTIHYLQIPCSMEAAISHNLASLFTSVPKTYGKKNLQIYLNNRMHHLNNYDLRYHYLKSLDIKPNQDRIKNLDTPIDLSIFDKRSRYDKSATSNWIKSIIARN